MPKRNAQRIEAELLDAFEDQLTEDSFRRVLEYGRRRVAMMKVAGVAVATDEAAVMSQDAITDTLTRVAQWEPTAVSLATHLRGVIRRRSWQRIQRARNRPHGSIEVMGDAGPVATASMSGERAPRPPDDTFGGVEVTAQIVALLEAATCHDAGMAALVAAYIDGASTRTEVIAATGLTRAAYVNARRRLDRVLAALPDHLQEAAAETLRRTS